MYLSAQAIAAMQAVKRVHFLNENAVRENKAIGDAAGLKNIGVHLITVQPGHCSTEYHFHHYEEECVYVLSGQGTVVIGGESHKVGPGDFMGFTKKSPPHGMTNPHKQELVYLLGGTRKPIDVSEYPRAGKRAYKFHGKRHTVNIKDVEER